MRKSGLCFLVLVVIVVLVSCFPINSLALGNNDENSVGSFDDEEHGDYYPDIGGTRHVVGVEDVEYAGVNDSRASTVNWYVTEDATFYYFKESNTSISKVDGFSLSTEWTYYSFGTPGALNWDFDDPRSQFTPDCERKIKACLGNTNDTDASLKKALCQGRSRKQSCLYEAKCGHGIFALEQYYCSSGVPIITRGHFRYAVIVVGMLIYLFLSR